MSGIVRIDRDQLGLVIAYAWSLRGTCARRAVGAALWDARGGELATGYNGPASGQPHCVDLDHRCPAADAPPGTALSACEAIHAEANALLVCRDVSAVHTCYVTSSPCLDCVKLLANTGCRRIVFADPYVHDDEARARWLRGIGRTWEHVPMRWTVHRNFSEVRRRQTEEER